MIASGVGGRRRNLGHGGRLLKMAVWETRSTLDNERSYRDDLLVVTLVFEIDNAG